MNGRIMMVAGGRTLRFRVTKKKKKEDLNVGDNLRIEENVLGRRKRNKREVEEKVIQ